MSAPAALNGVRMGITRYQDFTPRVHPQAWVHPAAELLGDVEIAEEASIWPTTVLRGDNGWIHIGARTSVQDGAVAHATVGVSKTTVGHDCTIGHRVVLHGCTVGNHCLIGISSTLLDNVEIGDWSFVAAGSLVTPEKKFPPRSFILGSPAKRIREVTEKEIAWIKHSVEVYVGLIRSYRGQ
jgi:carbonic anhydrase/acetyltransferase-like protein (isoleucine patch superfamily)